MDPWTDMYPMHGIQKKIPDLIQSKRTEKAWVSALNIQKKRFGLNSVSEVKKCTVLVSSER